MDKQEPRLVVVTGPSGAGKTVIAESLAPLGFSRMVTLTSRKPRGNEIDGVDYRFCSVEEFERMIAEGNLLEYNRYPNEDGFDYYGIPKKGRLGIAGLLSEGKDTAIAIDINGAVAIREKIDELPACRPKFLYIGAESSEALSNRLRKRGMSEERIAARMAKDPMLREQELPFRFDGYITNREGHLLWTAIDAFTMIAVQRI